MGVSPGLVHEYTLFAFGAGIETLLEEMKLSTDVLDQTFTLQLEFVFSKHTVACSNITMLCCVSHGSISHGLIFCFLSRETWSSARFSVAFSQFLILNSCRNQESWIASRIKSWMVLKLFEWLIHWWNNVWLITWVAWLNCLNGWLTDRQTVKCINWLAHFLNGW